MISGPCMNCEERHSGCHGECERYSKYKEERTRVNDKVKAARHEYWADKYVKRVVPSTKHFYNQ